MGCGESSIDEYKVKKSSSPSPNLNVQSNSNEISIESSEFESEDIRILLLGPSECGKTTLLRHFKMIFCEENDYDRDIFGPLIKINLIIDMKKLVSEFKNNRQTVDDNLGAYVENINNLQDDDEYLTPKIACEMECLWREPVIKDIYQKRAFSEMPDNTQFFLDDLQRISKNEYIPTNDDILRLTCHTAGVSVLKIQIDHHIKIKLIDVGGMKSERSRWSRVFPGVHYLMFVVSLSDFDQFLFEDNNKKRTSDSVSLFQNLINLSDFSSRPIFLIFNKTDLFEKKLKQFPYKFKEAYPDFEGDTNNVEACFEHVKEFYLHNLRSDRDNEKAWIEVIKTCAINEQSVRNLFQKVSKCIVDHYSKAETTLQTSESQQQSQNPMPKQDPPQTPQKFPQQQPQKSLNSNKNAQSPLITKKEDETSVYEYVSEYVTDYDSYSYYYVSS